VLGAAHRGGGMAGEDAAGDEPIEQHARMAARCFLTVGFAVARL
jgi:hypothetical protein